MQTIGIYESTWFFGFIILFIFFEALLVYQNPSDNILKYLLALSIASFVYGLVAYHFFPNIFTY